MLALRAARILARNSLVSARGQPVRLISTSKKNSETTTISDVLEKSEAKAGVEVKKKNWVTYGFDYHDEWEDRYFAHSFLFCSVSIALVFGTFFLAYYPDWGYFDWAQREAYLELRRREAEGLPAIDCNYVDPSKIVLPSDEDLAQIDIVI
ncbi:NADH dehydrogenase [ubiquinone] 1 beta subcomplex subunit 11, mitochondrial [Neocloeon triangulifer]|uniref:NADH dehydrogenase [ubiquinone] 1 beta subcomplex subunit 11, mitochondrial n=1 Tax=Neocloeon triangulifer TaxID=2078957 RepID=UPI00286F8079|nr:NADH dehydrogenase [ubiquinone] 1 beta subcomplex subunit 11, mitochondrial [Neocloeon triangulifer]